jgi:hypothetical protein
MESKGQKANINGNGIHFNYTNTYNKIDYITQEKANQETPININQNIFPNNNFTFKNSFTNSENQNENLNSQIPNNFNTQDDNKFQLTHSENYQNSENFLKKKREISDNNDEEKNSQNLKTEEKCKNKKQIARLIVTRIKSSSKTLVEKNRFGTNNENEIQNFNRQAVLENLASTKTIYSVNRPLHNLENQTDIENKKIYKKLESEFGNNENNLNLNENENKENFGNNFFYLSLNFP